MSVSRATQYLLRALAVAFIVGTLVAWILVPRLLESAYAGTSWRILNDLITGQARHSLQHYLDAVRHILFVLSSFALVMSSVAFGLSTERGRKFIENREPSVVPLVLATIALSWVAIRAMASLDLPHFGDKDEKIIAAWLISDGERLYESIFAHHGPLNYMIAHAIYVFTESKELVPYRIVQWVILGLGGIALAASPIFSCWRQRIYAASIFLILAAIFYPHWRGNELLYHVHGGLLFTTVLSLIFLPLILGARIPKLAAGIAGSAVAAMVAAAYPFAVPLGFMFIAASLLLLAQGRLWRSTKELIIPMAIGVLLVSLLVGGWLVLYGDPVGYFVYHIYFNQEVYAAFINFDPWLAFKQLSRIVQPGLGWPLWVVLVFILWLVINIRTHQKGNDDWRARILFTLGMGALLAAFLYLNPRNELEFKMAALQVTSVGLVSLIAARGFKFKLSGSVIPAWNTVLSLILLFLVAATQFTLLLGPLSRDAVARRIQSSAAGSKSDQAVVDAVQSWVGPAEPIQALVFNPRWYLLTQRRPASGHYYYLPWQAVYSRDPILGKNIDICADLKSVQPEVIIWDRWRVWGYDLKDYDPCLYELITTDYESVDGMPEVLRRSRR